MNGLDPLAAAFVLAFMATIGAVTLSVRALYRKWLRRH